MNDKMKAYILKNWDKYGLELDSQEKMLELLNILEAHNENLDGLHDVCFNGVEEFCGIYMTNPKNDAEVVKILHEFNCFFKGGKESKEFKEFVQNYIDDGCCESFEEFLETEDVRTTSDGIVLVLYY